jgi:hypothetical protein
MMAPPAAGAKEFHPDVIRVFFRALQPVSGWWLF